MDTEDSLLCVSPTHADADRLISALSRCGIDVTKLSLIGHGYHSEEHVLGLYTAGDRIMSWGRTGALWGGFWGLLLAPAAFILPGLGLVAMAGPVVSALFGALEGAVVVGGLSALGAALTMIGVPQDLVVKYEAALKADRYVLMLHGNAQEVAKARAAIASCNLEQPSHRPPVSYAARAVHAAGAGAPV
jgi:hypothetical protein